MDPAISLNETHQIESEDTDDTQCAIVLNCDPNEEVEVMCDLPADDTVNNTTLQSGELDITPEGESNEGPLEDAELFVTLKTEEADTLNLDKNNEVIDEVGADSDIESDSSSLTLLVPKEREEGDGQESERKDKRLDHDEDKRDPQYIPKKGNFYEHDDRTSESEETPIGKKHIINKGFDCKERWGHDLYDDRTQSPKSKEELIEQYGYDIRVEEGPPKARRRRRYGRGPNKYTRRWEEEEAYTKTRGSWRGRGSARHPKSGIDDFPPLPAKENCQKPVEEVRADEKLLTLEFQKETCKKTDIKGDKINVIPVGRNLRNDETHHQNQSRGRGRGGRGRGPQPFTVSSTKKQGSTAEQDIATLSQHFSEAVINVDNKSIPSQRASSVPPCGKSENFGKSRTRQSVEEPAGDKSGAEGKSKRYSTQRQRSLPQGTSAPAPAPVNIVQQPPPPVPPQRFIQSTEQQPFFHQVGLETTAGGNGNQYTNQQAASYTPEVPPLVTFMSATGHQFGPLPPPYMPPTFLPAPLTAQPRGPEVFQGPTGITYYNTHSQEGGLVRTEGLRCALARLRNRTPNNNNQNGKENEATLGEDIIASASTALRRLHFRGASRRGKLPSSIGSSQNTSTDSANTIITMVTVETEDGLPPTPSAVALLDELVPVEEPQEQLESRQIPCLPAKRLKLLSKRYAKTNFEDEVRHGRGSSGFAAEQMTIDSEYGSVDPPSSPPLPDSPTSRTKQELTSNIERKPRKSVSLPHDSKTSIVVQQPSVQKTSPELEHSLEQKRVENMRLLEVATTLTPDQLREFEMKYGSPHHSRSQSVKPRSRPNSLSLPPARTRVASMPNTGAEEHYYRLRHFSITGKGVINRGDYLKSKQGSTSTNSASWEETEVETLCEREPSNSYRVLMVGSSAVGKTSLISQFMTSEYLAPYDTSIDDDLAEKSVSVLLDGRESELVFIDHPSNQLAPECWMQKNSNAYCIVYSASDVSSFSAATQCLRALWAADITKVKAVILVSNKSDLVRSRVVSTQEGKDAARRYDCKFIETSVGLNHRVDELLVGVLSQIRLKGKPQEEQKAGLFPKARGRGTSASLKVKGLLSKVWARDSKSKSCENLHVL